MSDSPNGSILWHDLTVDHAQTVRDFYQQVVGWTSSPVSMGDYDDFSMNDADGKTIAGVCHARGGNANIPPQWMMYVRVADVAASISACEASGGKVVDGPRSMGSDRYCILQDPAGAVFAVYGEGENVDS